MGDILAVLLARGLGRAVSREFPPLGEMIDVAWEEATTSKSPKNRREASEAHMALLVFGTSMLINRKKSE